MQGMQVQLLNWEDPLEKQTAADSSILAWEIPWQRSLAGNIVHRVTKELDTTWQLKQQAHEKMLNTANYYKNANQNHNEIPPHTSQNGYH